MEKGRLRVTERSRYIKISGGKKVYLRKEIREIGIKYDQAECEFEGNPAERIVIISTGEEFSAIEAIAIKAAEREEREEFEIAYNELIRRQSTNGDSLLLSNIFAPRDTRTQVLLDQSDNFSLKLNRFARYEYKDNKGEEKGFRFFLAEDLRSKDRTWTVPAFQIKADFGDLFAKNSAQLADRQIQSAKALLKNVITPVFSPEWRFVTGLGGHSVYETGITLHHIYGIPYIPASSIKGVLRSWVIFNAFQGKEEKAISDQVFCDCFGCPKEIKDNKKQKHPSFYKEARKGKLVFFDALPREAPTIEPDIMNAHYPDWYGEKSDAPKDTENPIPVFFLTVTNTTFQFIIGTKAKPGEPEWDLDKKTFWEGTILEDWLKDALSEHGLGAKTAVGYGYFKKE